ncbi:MAG: hypothetical protein CM15mP58_05710 [Burkholderiaceae bacterium]|nr:MAG: hypothetical protein CM15mP58_05710 [Burkholderiaceae bacterium]
MLCDILGESLVSIAQRLTGHETSSLIQTLGSKGVNVFIGKRNFIPALKTTNEIDPQVVVMHSEQVYFMG